MMKYDLPRIVFNDLYLYLRIYLVEEPESFLL